MSEWVPDSAVVDAVLDGRMAYRDLSVEDSRWAVASLTQRGYSVADIAGWLKCSTRQVKRIRAELVTQVMVACAGQVAEVESSRRRLVDMRSGVRRLREDNARLRVELDAGQGRFGSGVGAGSGGLRDAS